MPRVPCPDCFGGRKIDLSYGGVEETYDKLLDGPEPPDRVFVRMAELFPDAVITCDRCHGRGGVDVEAARKS